VKAMLALVERIPDKSERLSIGKAIRKALCDTVQLWQGDLLRDIVGTEGIRLSPKALLVRIKGFFMEIGMTRKQVEEILRKL
jgi:hypothetical protein